MVMSVRTREDRRGPGQGAGSCKIIAKMITKTTEPESSFELKTLKSDDLYESEKIMVRLVGRIRGFSGAHKIAAICAWVKGTLAGVAGTSVAAVARGGVAGSV